MMDANTHITSYTYDELNRLATVTDPLSYVTSYAYDKAGNRIAWNKPDNTTVNYTYDRLDRLATVIAEGINISYTYDDLGNRLTLLNSTGTTSYTYDELNRLVQLDSPQGTLSYGYDLNNNRTSLTYPESKTVTYVYDPANRLAKVTDWSCRITTYGYDDTNLLTGIIYPNGVVSSFTYDNASRLTGISYTGAAPLEAYGYDLDAVGNRKSMTDADGLTSYTYDILYRLIGVAYPAGSPASVSYTYDRMGNRNSMTQEGVTTSYSYDEADRLLSTDTGGEITTFTWDNNGNMLTKGDQSFTWDALNRMVSWTDGTSTASYSYNGDGVRVGRTVNGTTTTYLQDLAAGLPVVLRETTSGANTDYVYGNDLLTSLDNSDIPSFYHSDGLGSTRMLTDNSGAITDRYSYDAFGSPRTHTGSSVQPFTFTGEQVDPEAGLVFLRARYYDPKIGRFIGRDLFVGQTYKPNGQNPYIYTLNRPNMDTDPAGLFSWPASYGSYISASGKIGLVGLSAILDIDIPAAEFTLSLNFIGGFTPGQAASLATESVSQAANAINFAPSGKIVGGVYAGSSGETSLNIDAFYGQGLIAGGSASHGTGNKT